MYKMNGYASLVLVSKLSLYFRSDGSPSQSVANIITTCQCVHSTLYTESGSMWISITNSYVK